MVDCKQVRSEIYAYLDGETDPEEACGMLEHLKRCKHCFSHYEFERALKRLIQYCGRQPHAGHSLQDKIASKIKGEE